MLSQLVRPLVQTQIRLLANSQATRSTLISTIARWLGYLGVSAQVTQLDPTDDRIQLTVIVGKPDACDSQDWHCILQNLRQPDSCVSAATDPMPIDPNQEIHFARLVAYLLQVGGDRSEQNWEEIQQQLAVFKLEESLLLNIRSALKVPQSIDQVLKKLDPDLAAIALPVAVRIALLDQQINSQENNALASLLTMMKAS